MRNEGFNIEYDIVNTINGKKFIDLPHNLYHMVKEIFGKLDDSKIIFAYRVDGFNKADIAIVVDNVTKYVSVKTARAEVVHQEFLLQWSFL